MRGWCGDASSSMDTAHSQRTKSTAGEEAAVSPPAPRPGALGPPTPTYGVPVQPGGAREDPATQEGVAVSAAHPQGWLQLRAAAEGQHIWRCFTAPRAGTLHPPCSCSLAAVHAPSLSLSILLPAPYHSLLCSCPTAGTGTGSRVYPG